MKQTIIFQLFKSIVLSTGLLLGLSACEDDSMPEQPTDTPLTVSSYDIDPNVAIKPEKIVITMYDGHSHIYPNSSNPEPGKGIIFYGETGTLNPGFHANPYDPNNKYPLKRVQSMTFELQKNGSYKQKEGEDAFRVEASQRFNGGFKALIIKMYDKDGQRIDLKYKTPELRDRTQVFFLPNNPQFIKQTKVEGINVADTAYLIENETSDSKERFLKVLKEHQFDPKQPLALDYEVKGEYTTGMKLDQLFSYYYCDRATDDTSESPTLKTPVGFRGVFENRASYVSYNVDILVTVLPEGQTKGSNFTPADSPSAEQLKHVALAIRIPFRNIVNRYDSNFLDLAQPAREWFNTALGEYSFMYESDIFAAIGRNIALHIPIKREFPQYTMEELIQMYEGVLNADPESADFWL